MNKTNTTLFMDSNEELWHTEADKLGCKVISMPYVMDGKLFDYWLGKDFDGKDFFDKIRKGSMPTTCALNPEDYISYFEPVFKEGKDIFYIHFSNKLSATFKFMETALEELKKKYPNRKLVAFDTLSVSVGAGMMVRDMAKMFGEGASVQDVVKYGNEHRNNYSEVFTVADLNHLKRGGRLSAVQAFVGSVLCIKPILKITSEGELKKISQVNGRKKSISAIVSFVKESALNIEEHETFIIHADCEKDALLLKEQLKKVFPNLKEKIQIVGPTVGTHCGPDTLGVAFYAKNR